MEQRKKRLKKKDWTKNTFKKITETVQKMTDDESDGQVEPLMLALKRLRGKIS